MDFKGKTAVITGGASGVGKALGSRLLREGMQVVLSDVEKGPLEETVAELGPLGAVSGVVCDVSKFDQVENLAKEAVARHQKVHLLCNNAGVGFGRSIKDTLAPNYYGSKRVCEAFLPKIESRICNIGSASAPNFVSSIGDSSLKAFFTSSS